MQKITPFLWFDNQAEEAMNFYASIFKNSHVKEVRLWGKGGPAPEGSVMGGTVVLDGQEFFTLNGGPHFSFTPAISLFVNCETQDEIDELWSRLSAGGEESRCGWLKDKYGVSWQIIPGVLSELMADKDPARAGRAMQAMMKMTKIDIQKLQDAAAGV